MRLVQVHGADMRGVQLEAFDLLPRVSEQGGNAFARAGELLYLAFRSRQ